MNKNIEKLMNENPDLAAFILSQNQEINNLKKETEALQFTLSKLNRNIFGKKSERSSKEEECKCQLKIA